MNDGDMLGHVIKGRYKLIDERGRGNFATVYVTRDLETNRLAAIKVMRPEHVSEGDLVARFQREAHILSTLSDSHIVRVIDHGNDYNTYFIVMDYVDGHNLKEYLTANGDQIEPLRALDYAHQIAEGLDTAYKRGVVHRDIKPQNIMINSKDIVKIADFGLARSQQAITLTESNVFMGTAYYIAPEQAESGKAADTRSDLYSVAIVLFEMITGHPPFEGDTVVDVVMKHMQHKVPSLCRMRHDLPPDIDIFMQKALAKLPADRFATPQAFIAALEQVQERILFLQQATPSALKAEARFIVLQTRQIIPLLGEELTVGRRDPTMVTPPEIDLADMTVGRKHASLRQQNGLYTVEDLNALNKTRLNGVILAPHEPQPLKDGDILRFGNVEVRFEARGRVQNGKRA